MKITAFAQDKGNRLGQAAREQLAPLVNDKGLVAARLMFLYEADGQMLAGSVALQIDAGAGQFLEELVRQRFAGDLGAAHKVTTVHQQTKKS